MKVGETRKAVSGITGYSTRTYKIITENGQTTEVLANTSNYIKRDEVVYVGTIQPTPAQPETPPAETQQEETPQPESGAQQGESQPSGQAAEGTT